MKIVVIGGTGLIGSKTVAILRQRGHDVVAASPNSGVNTITGEGLKEAMAGAQVVIDLANSPSFEDKAVLEFFETSGRNLRGGARGGRPAPCRAIHRRNRPDARQRLFPRQGRPGETDRGLRHPLHHHPLDPVPGIPPRHRRFKRGWKQSQDFARPVPAHRGGRCCRLRCRCGARGAAKRYRRDRRPGTSTVQRNRRPLSEGGRRPA
jgi:NAD dependent epimerase/dehydratase family